MVDFAPIRWIDAALGRNSQQWRRQIEGAIDDLRRDNFRRGQSELNANKSQNSSARLAGDNVRSLPVVRGYFTRIDAFGLPSSALVQEMIVPEGKTKVVLTAVSNVSVLDTTSGGVAVAFGRITVENVQSPLVSASKDTGASQVNNVIVPAIGVQLQSLTPGSTIKLTLTINATNNAAFPAQLQNFATVTITAIFFD